MALGAYTSAAWTANGGLAVAAGASVEVRREDNGEKANPIYADRAGNTLLDNPFEADSQGRFRFHAAGLSEGYRVKVSKDGQEYELRHQAIGTAQEHDASSDATPGYVVLRDEHGGAKLAYTIMPDGDEPTNEADEASLFAITQNGETQLKYRDGQGRTFDVARDSVFIVRNNTGVAMSAGDAVYVASQTGNVPDVALARADSASTMPAVGLLAQDLADGAFGKAIRIGAVHFDTSSFSVGDRLFVSVDTAGAITATRPALPHRAQFVGTVIVSGAGNGRILADVTASSTTADDASVSPDANTVALRDADGRTQVANPEAAVDVANKGYVDGLSSGGLETTSGDGSTVAFQIAHGLSSTPESVSVTPASADAAAEFYVSSADATNIEVTYTTAPPADTDNLSLYWAAKAGAS